MSMVRTQNNISTDFIFAMRILIPFLVVIGLLSRQRPLLDFLANPSFSFGKQLSSPSEFCSILLASRHSISTHSFF
jgi:hypothetical protein